VSYGSLLVFLLTLYLVLLIPELDVSVSNMTIEVIDFLRYLFSITKQKRKREKERRGAKYIMTSFYSQILEAISFLNTTQQEIEGIENKTQTYVREVNYWNTRRYINKSYE
jgi:hypothetical protein